MTQPDSQRQAVRSFFEQLVEGRARPHEVFEQARTAWLSGFWPGPGESGYDPIAHDVLFLLAEARRMGVSHEDAAALMRYLDQAATDPEASRGVLDEHFGSVDPATREALQQSDDYYGARPLQAEDEDLEIGLSNPEHRRLHKGVRLDPESARPDLRALLCHQGDPFDHFRVDLVEDLIHHHADAFIDRIEALVEECASAATTVAWAHVGGSAGPAIDRFEMLQQRLLSKLAPDGNFQSWRDIGRR